MFKLVRIVASNPEKQTVDIVLDARWVGFMNKDTSTNMYIRRNVPYVTPMSFDTSLPYIWGDIKGQALSKEFKDKQLQYGPSFVFGRTYNPAYFKFIHEKYYQKRGTNPKIATAGILFRPPEGSLALFDTESTIIVGFLSLSASVSKDDTEYTAPSKLTKNGFSTEYADKFRYDTEPKDIIRFSQTSTGFNSDIEIKSKKDYLTVNQETLNLTIDELTKQDVEASTYPNTSAYVYWRSICPAHVENLTSQFKRFKQNDIKRINDVFMLQGDSVSSNRALKASPSEYASLSTLSFSVAPLFSNGSPYYPYLRTLSSDTFSITNSSIYSNLVTQEEVLASQDIDSQFYQYKEQDIHIAPESGIEHYRTGKIIIYSDITDTFADSNKPLDFDEYTTSDTDFYNTISKYDTNIQDLLLHIKSYDYISASGVTNDRIFEYKLDAPNLDSPEVDFQRTIHAYDDRGSYFITDPSYVEISSDTTKGGWLLTKSTKRYERVREFSKTTVFYPFEVFRDLTETNYIEGNAGGVSGISFEHDDEFPPYQVYTDNKIVEGTWGLESPLVGIKCFRSHTRALRSLALEVKSDSQSIDAGIYLGGIDSGGSSNGGTVLIKAGYSHDGGGTIASSQASPELNQGGTIKLDAHEIHLNCNRLIMGQIRLDQNEKMQDLNLGSILLSLIPMFGSAAKNIGTLIFNMYPMQVTESPDRLK